MPHKVLVIGAGPAGLMAAEVAARAGSQVLVADRMPSPARKFLMAGKSGLNLTKVETPEAFRAAFPDLPPPLAAALDAFGPDEVQDWARGLGQQLFTGSPGRVFPQTMKASPLLRAWLGRLDAAGVSLRTRWRWTGGFGPFHFDTPDGSTVVTAQVTVLALGGASWARLGSDGAWADAFTSLSLPVARFEPANAALAIDWSSHMAKHFGQPVKAAHLRAGPYRSRGEFIISARGLEGGAIYEVSRGVREGAPLTLDLTPDWTLEEVARRLDRPRGKATVANHIRKSLRLDPLRLALLQEFARPLPAGRDLAERVKALKIQGATLAPMDEAISTAGGVAWSGLDDTLMLRDYPGVFCAGEMIDWEAPTGGYLITGCLATGDWAGKHAAKRTQGS